MFFELLKNRRSVRKFLTNEVEKEKIDRILKSVLMSPSSRSRKPWEFIAVTDRQMLLKLAQVRQNNSMFLVGAPLGIVVIADKESSDIWIEDATIAAIIAQMSVHAQGLGSCWIHIRDRMHSDGESADEYVKKLLEIPDKYSVECILAIGYSGEEKEPHDEEKLNYDKLHLEKFGYCYKI